MYGETPEARGQAFGTMISPKVGAMALGGIGSAVEKAAPAIYRSALGRGLETVTENPKTGESKVPGVSVEQLQNRVVSQGIDKGLIASRAGAKGSRLNTKAYKAEIDRRISDIETQQLGPGNVVSRDAVANYVDPTQMPDLNTVNRAQDTATAMAVKDKFVADRTPQMPASESQAVKVATDKSLGERAFQGISGPAEKGELRLRTGLMNELESLDPGLEGVNQNTQTSIFLTRAILKAAKSTNTWKQATSTPNLITSGLGYATLGYKGAIILPILRQIIDRPDVKSALAIAIDRMAKFKADQGISSQPLNPALYGQGEQDRQP
jgi:hypothetical protein